MKDYLDLYFNHQINYQDSYSKEQTDIVLTPFHETSKHSLYKDTPIIMVKFPLNLTFLQKVETIIKEKQKRRRMISFSAFSFAYCSMTASISKNVGCVK